MLLRLRSRRERHVVETVGEEDEDDEDEEEKRRGERMRRVSSSILQSDSVKLSNFENFDNTSTFHHQSFLIFIVIIVISPLLFNIIISWILNGDIYQNQEGLPIFQYEQDWEVSGGNPATQVPLY